MTDPTPTSAALQTRLLYEADIVQKRCLRCRGTGGVPGRHDDIELPCMACSPLTTLFRDAASALAASEAQHAALRELAAKWGVRADGHEERAENEDEIDSNRQDSACYATRLCVRDLEAALSASPPPSARQTTEDKADTRNGEPVTLPSVRATVPTDEASPSHRWNIEPQADGSVYVCRGGHHRSADCEWERFVPASRRGDEPFSLPMSGQPGDASRNAAKIPEGTAEATPASLMLDADTFRKEPTDG